MRNVASILKRKIFLLGLITFILLSFPATVLAESFFPFRGDQGPLEDFQPQAAVWLADNRLLVADLRFNNLQLFDEEGRRFRLFEAATNKAPAQFVGMCQLGVDDFLILGSHYHEKNHPRYRDQRSRFHRFFFNLEREDLRLDDFKLNLSPAESLRQTRMWGSSPTRLLKFAGFGVNSSRDIAWFGLAMPASEKGNLSLLRCSLKGLLAQDEALEFTEVDTGFKLPLEKRSQRPMYLTDLEVLDDGSLLLLLTADDLEGKRLCTNSLWRWKSGGKATLVKDDLASENRATAMAVRHLGQGKYKVALICDNATAETEIPSRLVILDQALKIH
jgi:hypothetical protein